MRWRKRKENLLVPRPGKSMKNIIHIYDTCIIYDMHTYTIYFEVLIFHDFS